MPVSSPPTFNPAVAPITLGAAGSVLTSNGVLASAPPTFQTLAGRLIGSSPILITASGAYNKSASAVGGLFLLVGGGAGTAGHIASATALLGTCRQGAGGGSGAWSWHFIANLAASYDVTIGAAGAAGAAGANNGGNGGNTILAASGGAAIVTAPGAAGIVTSIGANAFQAAGRGGALASGGNILNSAGVNGLPITTFGASATNRFLSGGGGTPWGAGGRATDSNAGANVVGEAGTGFGGGAAGSFADDGVNPVAGAAGTQGVIMVWEYS